VLCRCVPIGFRASNYEQKSGQLATLRRNIKNTQYRAMSTEAGFDFLPFVYEANGLLDAPAVEFIRKLANQAARSYETFHAHFTYFIRILSLKLQSTFAQSISLHLTDLEKRTSNHNSIPTSLIIDDLLLHRSVGGGV
jgi:hypothetical protein